MSNYSNSPYQPNVIWTVAGSDSCAGAGLQTDLHTFHDFNLVGCSVVTSVTAQHPHGVLCVTPVDDHTFRQQFEALLVQGYPNAIKIGLLCSQAQVEILCEYIQKSVQKARIIVMWFTTLWQWQAVGRRYPTVFYCR